jgi:hypothetical protein
MQLLVTFHMWTAISIHRTLGDFGWFYGDFFIESLRDSKALTYTGIYRFLNHPNAWASTASAWGITWMCSSWPLLWVTVFSHACTWLFVYYVEGPHMNKMYGPSVRPRQEAAMEKALRKGVKRVAKKVKKMGDVGIRRVISSSALGNLLAKKDDDGDAEYENSEDEDFDEGGIGLFIDHTAGTKLRQSMGATFEGVDEEEDDVRSDTSNRSDSVFEKNQYNLRRRQPRIRSVSDDYPSNPLMQRTPSITDKMSEAVDRAKVRKIVETAQMLVKSRVEKIASV